MIFQATICSYLSIFFPGLYFEAMNFCIRERLDILTCSLDIRKEWNIEVYGHSADEVVVLKFVLSVVFWDIDHEVEDMAAH